MRRIILGVVAITTCFLGAGEIYAQCSCIKHYASAYEEFKDSDAVFVGEVIGIRKANAVKDTESYEFNVKFKVRTAWKTDSTETVTLRNTASHRSEFKEGESYLVYARVRNNKLSAFVGCCSRTRLLSKAADDLEEFENKGEKQKNIIKASPKDDGKTNKALQLTQHASHAILLAQHGC